MTAVSPELLETLASGCDIPGQPDRWAGGYDPWETVPGFAESVRDRAGLPGPARQCGRWLGGDGRCRHYAAFLVTIGCVREHVVTRPSCCCCLAYALTRQQSGQPLQCADCGEDILIGQYTPLYSPRKYPEDETGDRS